MSLFKCTVCGYIYNESKGEPEKNISPNTQWYKTPDDFLCPICGAPKSAFEQENPESSHSPKEKLSTPENIGEFEKLGDLSPEELSAIFSNLAKGCEKQYLLDEMQLFNQLANYFKSKTSSKNDATIKEILKLADQDLQERFLKSNVLSSQEEDRGALRALVWSEKVTRMLKSILSRYEDEGSKLLENKNIYVCEICGFVFTGEDLLERCPVCKVPNYKMTKVERG